MLTLDFPSNRAVQRCFLLTIIASIIILSLAGSLVLDARAILEVGVKPGDWIEYELDWDTHPPFEHAIWTRREILDVQGTVLTVNITWQWYHNGSIVSKVEEGDLLTGGGQAAAGIFIPANLEEGDIVEIWGFGSQIINGTAQRVYLGVERTVVWSEFTKLDMHILVYWDREKGTALETRNTTPSFDLITTVKDVSPGFWELVGQLTLNPTDDTYADYHNPISNYGDQEYLKVEKFQEVLETWQTIVWLKFNLSEVPDGAVVDVATLDLYATIVTETYIVYAYSCSDNSWTELTLTYSNMPNFNVTSMDSTIVSSGAEWYYWNVTEAVRNAVNGVHGGPDVVTIVLMETSFHGEDSQVSFYSKEGTELYLPRLTIHWIDIIPEYPSWPSILLTLVMITFAVAIYKRIIHNSRRALSGR